jgi:hypothetical protein
MPPIAKNVVDAEGLQLLAEWINSLDPVVAPSGPSSGSPINDHTAPTLSLSIDGGSASVTGPFAVSVAASEVIEGLTASDFTLSNARITSVTGSGSNWSLSLSPLAEGPGSISLSSDRVTDLVGNANPALASPLAFDFQMPVDPDNLLTNYSFENGLQSWDNGGTISMDSNARTGSQAVTIGASSYVVQNLSITELANYVYSGWYFTNGSPSSLEAGLTFWDANGVWINDRTLNLPTQGSYGPFEIKFTAPMAATSVSIWILTGEGGSITIDDLAFETGGTGSPTPGPFSGPNRLPNGDFEDGIAFWDFGNDATITGNSSGGTNAVQLGSESFFVQTLPATPGENIALTGKYFAVGNSNRREIGFSFWEQDGTFLTDRTIVVPASASYTDLLVYTTIPENSATMTVWGWCGPGTGTFTVDDLRLTNETDANENLFTNGDFESGSLSPWDTGGTDVVLSGNSASGGGAGQINASSFIVHNQAANAGDEYTFSGRYQTSGSGFYEAGFTFWGAGGVLLGYGDTVLPPSAGYSPFQVVETLPSQTVAISVWVYNGSGGSITVDDLVLERTGTGTGEAIEGATSAGDVTVAAKMTGIILKNRENLNLDGLELRADDLPTQPDLSIRTRKSAHLGNDLYNRNGNSQTAISTFPGILKATYQIQWQNDATDLRDAAIFRGTGSNRHCKVTYYRLGRIRSNISALVSTGLYETRERAAGHSDFYEVRVKQTRHSRKRRFSGMVRAASLLDPGKVDVVKMRARKR